MRFDRDGRSGRTSGPTPRGGKTATTAVDALREVAVTGAIAVDDASAASVATDVVAVDAAISSHLFGTLSCGDGSVPATRLPAPSVCRRSSTANHLKNSRL